MSTGALTEDQVRELYRKRAPRYDVTSRVYGLVGYRLDADRHRGIEALKLKPGDTVVEIGCGTGANFAALERAIGPSGTLIGVDLTPEMLEQAGARVRDERWQNVTLVRSDAGSYAFPERVDGIFSSYALTRTARVHAAAWKRVVDDFLMRRSAPTGAPFVEFDSDDDYRRHVDGKPRTDGVVAFLESRNIFLAPDACQALASRKDEYFVEQLKELGVETYDAAVTLVRALRARGIKTAVVSSSMNC